MNVDEEPPPKWLVDMNPHLNGVHHRFFFFSDSQRHGRENPNPQRVCLLLAGLVFSQRKASDGPRPGDAAGPSPRRKAHAEEPWPLSFAEGEPSVKGKSGDKD